MSGINPNKIDGLVQLTQEKLIKRGAYLNLMTDLTDYVAVREVYKRRRNVFSGGLEWRFDVITDHNHSARFVQMYEDDGTAIIDSMTKGSVGPKFTDANYAYDIKEPVFQQGALAVVDYVKTKYESMIVSFWELLEGALWGKPVDSTDDRTPYGIPFWITRGATEGFTGGNPSGFTSGRAGISTAAYPRWANWSSPYSAISKSDLISKMRRATRKTQFRSPISHAEPTLGAGGNGIYTCDNVIGDMETILEEQNMNLGNDVAPKDGKCLFKGMPLTYAPKLDDDDTDPIYFIDWKWMALGMMEGWSEHLSKPTPVPGKHNVRQVFLDSGCNMVCTNLRRQAVFFKAA